MLQGRTEMTSSQTEQAGNNFVLPATTQLVTDVIATKDEQIQSLLTSVQDLKQQLASAQQHIAANEITIKDISKKFEQLEDCLDGTRLELTATTINGNQIKEQLTKQSETLEKFMSSSCHSINAAQTSITPINVQNAERMEEVTTIKDKWAQEVIATKQNLIQKFEKELATVKEEIQTCRNETTNAKDNLTASVEQLSTSLREEGKAMGRHTQQIKNIKQDLMGTKKYFNEKFTHTEGDFIVSREEMKKSREDFKVAEQEQVLQVAALITSHNKLKGNFNLLKYTLIAIVTFAVILGLSLSPYIILLHNMENITAELKTSCQDEMRNLSADLSSRIYTLSNNQSSQIQALNDTINAVQLEIKDTVNILRFHQVLHSHILDDIEKDINVTKSYMQAEGQSIAKLHDNISAVNKTTLETMNDLRAHCDYENMKMRNLVANLSSRVDAISSDQLLQLQKLADIEQDLNVTKSHVQGEIKTVELVAELQKNITTVNKTMLKIMNDVKTSYDEEIMKMRKLVLNCSSKVSILKNDQLLQSQRLHDIIDIERDINVTSKLCTQTEIKLFELVAMLRENISAINKTALIGFSELKAQQILLHCFPVHQYQKKLIIKALQQEQSLAESNYLSPVTVKVSGIYSMVNGNHAYNNYYQWANASVNIQGELVFVSLQKLDNAYFRIILCEPLPIWCINLSIQNQIEDSNHFYIDRDFSESDYKRVFNKINYVTGCFSYEIDTAEFEDLLEITPDCQYVVCDSIFIKMQCRLIL